MKPTDLAFNRALGIVEAPAGAEHLLELPVSPLVQNHLGTIHAAAQFALAEAASAECLRRGYAHLLPATGAMAVVRGVSVKYRRPGNGDLLAYARPDEATHEHLVRDLATRSRMTAAILVELKDRAGQLTFAGQFDWFIGKAGQETP